MKRAHQLQEIISQNDLRIPEWQGSLPNLLEDKYICSMSDFKCNSIDELDPDDTIVISLSDSVALYHSKVNVISTSVCAIVKPNKPDKKSNLQLTKNGKSAVKVIMESLAESPISVPASDNPKDGAEDSTDRSIPSSNLSSNSRKNATHRHILKEIDDIYVEILPDLDPKGKLDSTRPDSTVDNLVQRPTIVVYENIKVPPPVPPKPNCKPQANKQVRPTQPDTNSNSVEGNSSDASSHSISPRHRRKAERHNLTARQLVVEAPGTSSVEVKDKKQLMTVRKRNEALKALRDLVETGNPFDRYALGDLIDEGSSGKVYISRDLVTDTVVAIKIIDINSQPRLGLIVRELHALRMMSHSCVVNYLASYLHKSQLWIVMEYLDGGSLTKLCENMLLHEVHVATIVKQILRGLQFLHSNRVIHRDIKSDNILIGMDGSIKITDFGFCAQLHSERDKRNTFGGTPYWMSPEVIQHKPYDEKSDIWSLGMLVIELLQGEVPYFNDTPTEAMQKIVKKGRPKLSKGVKISDELDKFLDLCLEKRVEKRATATALLYHPFIMNNALSKHKLVPTVEALINKLYS